MRVNRNLVAEKAGVSSATVSRVFNSPSTVSDVLRNKVLAAAKELGYSPNLAAAQLRRSGTGVIAVVEIAKKGRPYYWGGLASFDWFYGQAMRGLQKAIEQTSWQLRFASITSRDDLKQLEQTCDGIIGYDIDSSDEEEILSDLAVPCILCHHTMPHSSLCRFSTDNVKGGAIQAQYLKDLGKKKPLYITGYLHEVEPHFHRYQGFTSVGWDHLQVAEVDFGKRGEMEKYAPTVKEMMRSGRIDSIAAVNDFALTKLLMHLDAPLASVGYDAAPFTNFLPGKIASIDVHIGTIYTRALSCLIAHLAGEKLESRTFIPSLVIKGEEGLNL